MCHREGKAAPVGPQVYLPAAQTDLYPSAIRLADLAVRADDNPRALVAGIRAAVWAVDPDQPITNVATLDEVMAAPLAKRRFNMRLLSVFSVLALTLAMVGVYGVVAFAVAQRTREIGIRKALAATERDVTRMVIRDGIQWVTAGILAGGAVALAVTRVMRGMLFGVSATDPATFSSIAAATILVALAASYLPARRAASIDPASALRTE